MTGLPKITEPTLILDEARCRENIRAMAGKARSLGLSFRPHFKTHQSLEIGRWFRQEGIDRMAVSSVFQAEYFAGGGWDDITIAFPANPLQLDRMAALAGRTRLNLLADSAETIAALGRAVPSGTGLFVEVDLGQGRSGVHHRDHEGIEALLGAVQRQPNLTFKGFLAHAGHVYRAGSAAEAIKISLESLPALSELKQKHLAGHHGAIVSYGDTPGASLLNGFPGVDELRPGNFVFHDLMQERLGVCHHRQIAVCLACPVVSVNRAAGRAVVHGGAVHLSREGMPHPEHGTIYGQAAFWDGRSFVEAAEAYVTGLTQEHGVITGRPEFVGKLRAGMLIAIYPVHSCLAAEAMAGYLTLDGRRLDHARAARTTRDQEINPSGNRNHNQGEGCDGQTVDAGAAFGMPGGDHGATGRGR